MSQGSKSDLPDEARCGPKPRLRTGSEKKMKALSIRPPWADLILSGQKDIENRTWRTNYRGPLLIHSEGAIKGRVDLIDIVSESESPWFTGPWGWVFKNPVRFKTPIKCRGRLSIFEIEILCEQ